MKLDYNKLSEKDFIQMVLNNKNLTPCLMIGNYVNAFKREFDGTIEKVTNVARVRNLIDEYEGIENVNSEFLAIEGIGYLSNDGQNALLKFIEESKLPIILLSYQDKVLSTIRSRMKIVVKHWNPVKNLSFVGESEGYKALLEKRAKNPDFKGNLEIQFLAETSPRLYRRFMESGNPFDSNNAKMLEIMSSKIDKAG